MSLLIPREPRRRRSIVIPPAPRIRVQEQEASPSLMRRIRNAWAAVRGPSLAGDDLPSTTAGVPIGKSQERLISVGLTTQRFEDSVFERERLASYRDYDAMDGELPEFKRCLDIITENTTASDRGEPMIRLVFAASVPEATQRLLTDTLERLQLRRITKPVVRETEKYGDCFAELVAVENMIVQVLPRSVYSMFRKHDEHGRLEYFVQKPPLRQQKPIEFDPGQIIHSRADLEWGQKYGSGIGKAARYLFRQFSMMNDAGVANRLTRAVQRYLFLIDTHGLSHEDALEYMDLIEFQNSREPIIAENGRLDLQAKIMSDTDNVYLGVETPGLGDVKVLEGSRTVSQVEDIRMMWRRIITMLPVPPAFMGIEDEVNSKATLTHQGIQFARFIRSVQEEVVIPFVSSLLLRQAKMMNRPLTLQQFEVKMPTVSILDDELHATIRKLQAETAKILGVDMGWPNDFLIDHILQLPSNVADDLKADLEEIEAEREEQPTMPEPAEIPTSDVSRQELGNELYKILGMRHDLRLTLEALREIADQKAKSR